MNTTLLYIDTALLAVPMAFQFVKKSIRAWAVAKMLKSVKANISKHTEGTAGVGSIGNGAGSVGGSASGSVGGSSSS